MACLGRDLPHLLSLPSRLLLLFDPAQVLAIVIIFVALQFPYLTALLCVHDTPGLIQHCFTFHIIPYRAAQLSRTDLFTSEQRAGAVQAFRQGPSSAGGARRGIERRLTTQKRFNT